MFVFDSHEKLQKTIFFSPKHTILHICRANTRVGCTQVFSSPVLPVLGLRPLRSEKVFELGKTFEEEKNF